MIISTPNDLFNLYNLNETIEIQIHQLFNTHSDKILKVINGLFYKIHKNPTIGLHINKNNYLIKNEIQLLKIEIYIYYANKPLEILGIRTKGL